MAPVAAAAAEDAIAQPTARRVRARPKDRKSLSVSSAKVPSATEANSTVTFVRILVSAARSESYRQFIYIDNFDL